MSDIGFEYCSSDIQETFASVIQFYITARNTDLVLKKYLTGLIRYLDNIQNNKQKRRLICGRLLICLNEC